MSPPFLKFWLFVIIPRIKNGNGDNKIGKLSSVDWKSKYFCSVLCGDWLMGIFGGSMKACGCTCSLTPLRIRIFMRRSSREALTSSLPYWWRRRPTFPFYFFMYYVNLPPQTIKCLKLRFSYDVFWWTLNSLACASSSWWMLIFYIWVFLFCCKLHQSGHYFLYFKMNFLLMNNNH